MSSSSASCLGVIVRPSSSASTRTRTGCASALTRRGSLMSLMAVRWGASSRRAGGRARLGTASRTGSWRRSSSSLRSAAKEQLCTSWTPGMSCTGPPPSAVFFLQFHTGLVQNCAMSFRPDPTFYPSPASAVAGPAEELAYVATLDVGTNGDRRPDGISVVDLKAGSSSYGSVVGRVEMPNVGDELHHFGWNACSSALCPWAPHPHLERRYLLIPGLRSSRLHVVDVKDDPVNPKLAKVIEADQLAQRTGYSRPHTIH